MKLIEKGVGMNEIKTFYDDCPECGGDGKLECIDNPREGLVIYKCTSCDYEGSDSYIDLYGCMSVPWGGI